MELKASDVTGAAVLTVVLIALVVLVVVAALPR